MGTKLKNAEYEAEEDSSERDDEESSDDDDVEEAEDVLQQKPRANAVYNSVALHEKLEEIGWPDGLDWLQTLCIDYQVEDVEVDVNDDLAREMAFYTQALEGTREAFTKLLHSGKPFLRPPDYYAEMVKSDAHMLKVKDALLSQQKQMEEAEERRKAREAKRFSKEVQAQKLKQRAQDKKQNIESVKKWRKMRQNGGFSGGDDEFPVDFDEDDSARGSKKRKSDPRPERPSKKFKGSGGRAALSSPHSGRGRGDFTSALGRKENGVKKIVAPFGDAEKGKQITRSPYGSAGKGSRTPAPWDRAGGKGGSNKVVRGKAAHKRQSRNSKYGHGGRKSFKKANTAESSAGFSKGKRKK